jgi:hypothetical protein
MQHFSEDYDSNIIDKINHAKKNLKGIVQEINKLNYDFYELAEIIKPRRIAALDGGGFSTEFVGISVIPARAAGAIFEKNKDPIWIERNDVEILTLEEDPKNYASLFRDYLELCVAQELANLKPDVLILDGSITNFAYKGIPESIRYLLEEDKDLEDISMKDKLNKLFLQFIKAAYDFITYCIENDVLLLGVSKDSRAKILTSHIYKKLNKKKPSINDTTLVNILAKGRKGFTKPIIFKPEIRGIREKIWKASNVFQEDSLQSFFLTYFILKEGAQPIRVDSLLPQKDGLKTIQEIMTTYHDGNGFITPAYLTHNRAHMQQDLGNRIVNYLAQSVLDDSPETFQAFLKQRRRDIIQ